MSFSNSYRHLFRRIYVDRGAINTPAVSNALSKLGTVPCTIVDEKNDIPAGEMNPHTLFVTSTHGCSVKKCPGSAGHVCCNYLTLDLYEGCRLGCTYCIMRSYLNFLPVTVNVDVEPAVRHIRALAARNEQQTVRIGTGEVGDSLHLDPLFRLSEHLIASIASHRNVCLELKTKTDSVDHLLQIRHKEATIVGFSLNPQPVVEREEGTSVSLSRRIGAARRCADHGYRVAFHFDPIFRYPGWEHDYRSVIDLLAANLGEAEIAWISLGTFRYTHGLKEIIGLRDYMLEEFVRCADGKYRYLQRVRVGMYRSMVERIAGRFPRAPVYLCMESFAVWRRVFGDVPTRLPQLKPVFMPVQGLWREGE